MTKRLSRNAKGERFEKQDVAKTLLAIIINMNEKKMFVLGTGSEI